MFHGYYFKCDHNNIIWNLFIVLLCIMISKISQYCWNCKSICRKKLVQNSTLTKLHDEFTRSKSSRFVSEQFGFNLDHLFYNLLVNLIPTFSVLPSENRWDINAKTKLIWRVKSRLMNRILPLRLIIIRAMNLFETPNFHC